MERLQKELYKVVNRISKKPLSGKANYSEEKLRDDLYSWLAALVEMVMVPFLALKQNLSEKGQANGYAELDGTGRLPISQMPISALDFQGFWNATTNVPTVVDGTGTMGDFYIVNVAGTQDLGGGSEDYKVDDWLIYDGATWNKNQGLGGGTFTYDGVVYVDENATESGVFGDASKPFVDIKTALSSIPVGVTHCTVKCLSSNPVFGGAGTTDIGGKTVLIDAKGKDLTADTETFNNTSINQLTIDCNSFTVDLGGSNIFWKNTNTASNIRIFCSDTYTATSGILSFYGTPHVITHDATLNAFMNATGGGMVHFKAHDVNSNNNAFGYNSQVFCEIEGTWVATGLAPFQLLTVGSVIFGSGEYFSSGNMFANCSGMLIRGTELSAGLSVINGGGSAYITDSVINATTDIANLPLTDCNIKGSTFNVTMSGQSSGEFALNVLGNSVIDDCIIKVLTTNYNGIEATSGNVEISDTHIILEDAEGLAWSGNYDLKGNNSKYPNVVTTPATPYAPTATERVFIDCTSGNKVVDLPLASKSLGVTYSIKKTGATANTVTIAGNGGDLVEGSATLVISVVNKTENLVCNGVGWFLI